MSDLSYNYDVSYVNISSFKPISDTNNPTIDTIQCLCSNQNGTILYCFATTNQNENGFEEGYIYRYDFGSEENCWIPYFDPTISTGPTAIPYSCITTNNLGNVVVFGTNNYYQGIDLEYMSTFYCSTNLTTINFYPQNVGNSESIYTPANNIIDVTVSGQLSDNTVNIIIITMYDCYLYTISGIGTANVNPSISTISTTAISSGSKGSDTRSFTSVSITNDGNFFALSSTNTKSNSVSSNSNSVYISGIYIFNYTTSITGYVCIQVLNNVDYPYSFSVSLSSYTSTSTNSTTVYDLTVVASSSNELQNNDMVILYETINFPTSPTDYGTSNSNNDSITLITNISNFYDLSGTLTNNSNEIIGFEPSNSGEFQIAFTPQDLFITNDYGVNWYQQPINILEDGEKYTSIGVTNYDPSGLLIFYLGTNQGHIWEIYTDISGVEFQTLDASNNPVATTVENFIQKVKSAYNNLQSNLDKSLFHFLMIWPYITNLLIKICISVAIFAPPPFDIGGAAVGVIIMVIFKLIYCLVIQQHCRNISFDPSSNINKEGDTRKFFILWNLGKFSTKHKIRQWLLKTFGYGELRFLIQKLIMEIYQDMMTEGEDLLEATKGAIAPYIEKLVLNLLQRLIPILANFRSRIYENIYEKIYNEVQKLTNNLEQI